MKLLFVLAHWELQLLYVKKREAKCHFANCVTLAAVLFTILTQI